ncbi:MAG: exonuclease SbcCD subunit D, partial [Actinomycetales bacterium]
MRVLHTSDWHLGRTLETWPLVEHQSAFLTWLAQLCRERQIEAILVSGDIYDRAVPSVEAVQLLEEALASLVRICPIVLISGNHDSAVRLGFGGTLLESVNVHFRSSVADIARPIHLTGADGTSVLISGVPYLEPQLVRGLLACDKSHAAVLTAAMDLVRADLAERSADASSTGAGRPRSVVMAHAFITGGQGSDSERDVSVGGVADAPASVFDGVDYVALGHLHGPQEIAGPSTTLLRYSGSPLAYSFSEEGHLKSVAILDIAMDGPIEVELVPAPVPRGMRTITGDLVDLLSDPELAEAETFWIRAIVTDAVRPEHAMERLRRRFPHAIAMDLQPHRDGMPLVEVERRVDPRQASPVEVVAAFVEHVTYQPATQAVCEVAQEAVERVRVSEAVA